MSNEQTLGVRRLRELLNQHRVMLTKSLGQNFVVDPNTIRKIVDTAGVGPHDHVLEIGAGAGSLTLELARRAGRVTALEIDRRMEPLLADTLAGASNVEVVYEDVLTADLTTIGATSVVANLPYNIAAQTVIKVLQTAPAIENLYVMTQREVGERLAAGPGSKVYGLTSVLVGFYADATVASRISRNVFFPVPSVDSVLVEVKRRDAFPAELEDRFTEIARAAFGQRRKNLRNSLGRLAPSAEIEEALATVPISADARAETLSTSDFVALARALS